MLIRDWLQYFRSRSEQARGRRPRERRDRSLQTSIPAMIQMLEPRRLLSGVSASPDSFTVTHDQPLTRDAANGVLSNDSGWPDSGDPPGFTGTLTASVTTGPSHGSLSLNADGSFTYTPTAGYVGSDSFAYNANFGTETMEATVSLDVVNNPPWATVINTSFTVSHDQILDVTSPVATAYDYDNDSLTQTLVDDVEHGTLELHPDGTFTYTPDAGYVGADGFSLKFIDPLGAESNEVAVTIDVVNNPPWATGINTSFTASHDQILDVTSPVAIAYDYDNDTLMQTLIDDVQHGTLELHSDGTFSYTPEPGYVGTDGFSLKFIDPLGVESNEITIEIDVTNASPSPGNDGDYLSYGGDVVRISIATLLENDCDMDDPIDPASFTFNATAGLTIRRIGNELLVTPPMPELGAPPARYTFTYMITDSLGATGTGTVGVFVYGTSIKEAWIATINRQEAQHIGYRYYTALGLANAYSMLRSAAERAEYQFGSTGSGNAVYSSLWDTVTIPTGTTTLNPTTVIHETVHMADDFNSWYLGSTTLNSNVQYAERLAWAGENFLLGDSLPLNALRSFEDHVFDGSPHTVDYIQSKWNFATFQWLNLLNPDTTYTYPLWGGNTDVAIGFDGWMDFWSRFEIGGLGSVEYAYEQELLIAPNPYTVIHTPAPFF